VNDKVKGQEMVSSKCEQKGNSEARFIQQSSTVNDLILKLPSSKNLTKAMALFGTHKSVGGLAAADAFETEELQHFLALSQCGTAVQADGSEPLPGEFIKPMWNGVELGETYYNLLIEFYHRSDTLLDFQPLLAKRKWKTVCVNLHVTQFGHLYLSGKIFGSAVSPMHQRSSYVLVNWIQWHTYYNYSMCAT
jgi:hypothetical protein